MGVGLCTHRVAAVRCGSQPEHCLKVPRGKSPQLPGTSSRVLLGETGRSVDLLLQMFVYIGARG